MGAEELKTALEGAREIEITVTGRTSGRQITIPVWFVQEGGAIYLLPVRGPGSDWYKNSGEEPDDPSCRRRCRVLDPGDADHRAREGKRYRQ